MAKYCAAISHCCCCSYLTPSLKFFFPFPFLPSASAAPGSSRQSDRKTARNLRPEVPTDVIVFMVMTFSTFKLLNLFNECHAIDFVESGLPLENQSQGGFAQASQTFLNRNAPDFRSGFAINDQFADVVGHIEQFVNRRAPTIARVVADFATDCVVIGAVAELRWRQP